MFKDLWPEVAQTQQFNLITKRGSKFTSPFTSRWTAPTQIFFYTQTGSSRPDGLLQDRRAPPGEQTGSSRIDGLLQDRRESNNQFYFAIWTFLSEIFIRNADPWIPLSQIYRLHPRGENDSNNSKKSLSHFLRRFLKSQKKKQKMSKI